MSFKYDTYTLRTQARLTLSFFGKELDVDRLKTIIQRASSTSPKRNDGSLLPEEVELLEELLKLDLATRTRREKVLKMVSTPSIASERSQTAVHQPPDPSATPKQS